MSPGITDSWPSHVDLHGAATDNAVKIMRKCRCRWSTWHKEYKKSFAFLCYCQNFSSSKFIQRIYFAKLLNSQSWPYLGKFSKTSNRIGKLTSVITTYPCRSWKKKKNNNNRTSRSVGDRIIIQEFIAWNWNSRSHPISSAFVMAKHLVQLIIAGAQVVGKAFSAAVRQEIRMSQEAAKARSSASKNQARSIF